MGSHSRFKLQPPREIVDDLPLSGKRFPHQEEEEQEGGERDERAERGDNIVPQIDIPKVGVPSRYPIEPQEVLGKEGQVDPQEYQEKLDLK